MRNLTKVVSLFLVILITGCNVLYPVKNIEASILQSLGNEIIAIEDIGIYSVSYGEYSTRKPGKLLKLDLPSDFDDLPVKKRFEIMSKIYVIFCAGIGVDPNDVLGDSQYQVEIWSGDHEYNFYYMQDDFFGILVKMDYYELHHLGNPGEYFASYLITSYDQTVFAYEDFVQNERLIGNILDVVGVPSKSNINSHNLLIIKYINDKYEYYDKKDDTYTGDKYTNSILSDASKKFGLSKDQIEKIYISRGSKSDDATKSVGYINRYLHTKSDYITCATTKENYAEFMNHLLATSEAEIIEDFEKGNLYFIDWITMGKYIADLKSNSPMIQLNLLNGDHSGSSCFTISSR